MGEDLKKYVNNTISPSERVQIARNPLRPNILDYVSNIFTDSFEIKGDRLSKEDKSIFCALAFFKNTPVTVIGHRKGRTLEENLNCNFGMPGPEGYRKALRAMKQAEKFERPIITFIDTPGAYPGIEAEANGQSFAIAECIKKMSSLKVPVITIITGEGNSGGALALAVSDRVFMLENSVYSILSPEGFATILWKDVSKSVKAAEVMKLTAYDLYEFGIIDEIIKEPVNGLSYTNHKIYERISLKIDESISALQKLKPSKLVEERYKRYRKIGDFKGDMK